MRSHTQSAQITAQACRHMQERVTKVLGYSKGGAKQTYHRLQSFLGVAKLQRLRQRAAPRKTQYLTNTR